ncbi:MAG: queuosine precursor transporter [Chloroflexi bacterium]|nr:queuosine precursor transporter [Chloroflexota bacterium]
MAQPERRTTMGLVVVAALFVTTLITANIIAVKLIAAGPWLLPAAIVIFPVSYIIGDLLTEVYGYRRARQVIWLGFLCNLVAVAAIWAGQVLPGAAVWDAQAAYERILGLTPRLLAASFVAYLAGEFANAYVLARLKVATQGRWLWLRTVSSTVVGQGLDSALFLGLAFFDTLPLPVLLQLVATQWLAKVAYEAAATPLTYLAVGVLKRVEGLDVYDRGVAFNPLRVVG